MITCLQRMGKLNEFRARYMEKSEGKILFFFWFYVTLRLK